MDYTNFVVTATYYKNILKYLLQIKQCNLIIKINYKNYFNNYITLFKMRFVELTL